ncbi:MAG: ferredoxin--NADP reductase [Deltaproteobacteria bacterium]|nr:ferredoxin--NADP reductase [Deltaproteobacteria bacterium]
MLNATITQRIEITPELVVLRVKPDAELSEFHPGQYVALGLYSDAKRPEHFPPEREPLAPGKLIKRAYSIGSSPSVREYLEFYIAIVPDGALTSRLALAKEGDRVFLAPKITGTFTLHDVPADANLVLVSTGTGIAPFMSMLRTPSTWTAGRKISVIHGVRYPKDLAYRDELSQLSSEGTLAYYPIVSREDPSWKGERGHLQKLFERSVVKLNPATDHVFLCGNPAMIDEMEKLLLSQGYVVHSKKTPGNLHLEKYW